MRFSKRDQHLGVVSFIIIIIFNCRRNFMLDGACHKYQKYKTQKMSAIQHHHQLIISCKKGKKLKHKNSLPRKEKEKKFGRKFFCWGE
jgi:hypothetical protein